MTYDELRELCAASSPDNWHVTATGGYNSGPAYIYGLREIGTPEGIHVEVDEPGNVAAYKPDLRVALAWGIERSPGGLSRRERFNEPWATGFPDSEAHAYFVDFFFCGQLVDREIYVAVDGGRCYLPLPEMQGKVPNREDVGYTITEWQHRFFKLLNDLTMSTNFEGYIHRAGLTVLG